MSTTRQPVFFFCLVSLSFSLAFCLTGCQYISKIGKPQATPIPGPAPTPGPPAIDYATIKPNELGTIPVVMYHEIGGNKKGQNDKMHRTVASFQKDLELLYSSGYRPVNLGDVVSGKIDVPAGKKPVVLTFDDSRRTQFILTETTTEQQIDDNCAVGILEDFSKQHPDWPHRATFFVLPPSRGNADFFAQKGLGAQKLEYLANAGYEIGNHTYLHKSLRPMNAAQIQEALGLANNEIIKAFPGVKIATFAVPMGQYPRDKKLWPLLKSGTYKGTPYNHIAVMDAAWRPMQSPFAKKYNAMRLERITPEDINFGLAYWLKMLEKNHTTYVSDGDPTYVTYPSEQATLAEPARLQKMGLRANPYGASLGAKPITATAKKPIGAVPKPVGAAPKPVATGSKPATNIAKPIKLVP
jgi:peptidoglycan/xylan/chitin deacetylase (PgdA/CDA1 family)